MSPSPQFQIHSSRLGETKSSYELVCAVFDSDDTHNDTITVTITVTDISDTRPVFEDTPYQVAISSNLPTDKVDNTSPFQVLFKPRVTDEDENDPLSFSTTSSQFTVNSMTGEISPTAAISTLPDAITTISLPLSVTDPVFTITTTVTIQVYRDTNTPPSITTLRGDTIPEDSPPGSTAGVCLGSAVGPITYSLSNGHQGLFAIDSVEGVITTVGDLDYEMETEYSVECGVADIHGNTVEGEVVVRVSGVNEFPPEFERSVYNFKAYDPPNRDDDIQSDPDLVPPDLVTPRFSDRINFPRYRKELTPRFSDTINFPRYRKLAVFDPDLVATPI
eukprot:sb/3466616/